jgi:hypothetical protein
LFWCSVVDQRHSSDVEQEIARLKRLNAELAEGLRHCRETLDGWRSRMAANSNDVGLPDFPWKDDDKRIA